MSTPSEPERAKTTPAPAATTTPQAPPRPPAAQADRPSTWQPMLWLRLILLAAIVAYVIAFVVENTDEITIDFVFATTKVHLIWEMLLLLGCGVLGGVLLSQLYRARARARAKRRDKLAKAGDAGRDLGGRDEAKSKPG